jgi:hypothetical protein
MKRTSPRLGGYRFVLAEEYESSASGADQIRSTGIRMKLELNGSGKLWRNILSKAQNWWPYRAADIHSTLQVGEKVSFILVITKYQYLEDVLCRKTELIRVT